MRAVMGIHRWTDNGAVSDPEGVSSEYIELMLAAYLQLLCARSLENYRPQLLHRPQVLQLASRDYRAATLRDCPGQRRGANAGTLRMFSVQARR